MNLIVWLVLLGLLAAIMMSSILSVLDSNSGQENEYNLRRRRTFRNPSEWPEMSDNFQNIFWVVQLTDLHISAHQDFQRSSDLLRFCSEYLPVIDPEIVLISGDLTHAKDHKDIVSGQIEQEWKTYSKVTHQCQKLIRAKWFDIRGNHDVFDVMNHDSTNSYFRSHSAMENPFPELVRNNSGYHHRLHLPFGTYSFIGIDAVMKPGPKTPFNFFGSLDDREIAHIKKMEAESRHSNQTVWFGHFPTSLITHNPAILRDIMSNGIAYLCGHLHTLGDYVPHMYSRQKSGILEFELGDWKFKRMFRVVAFDHDLMSLTDDFLGNWPVILVTNPKDSQFHSKNEPMEMIRYSTHIRILIFNPTRIVSAVITIDNLFIGEAEQVKGPLYVCPWDPLEYGHGLHTIHVTVRDETGNQRTTSHSFSIDGTSEPFRLLNRIILMPNLVSLGKISFGVMVFLYTLILTSMRQCEHIRNYYVYGLPVIDKVFNSVVTKVWLASRTKSSYVILITSILYLTFGPWFVDELLTGHMGVVFVWGIVFPGAFISGGQTYFHGIFQMDSGEKGEVYRHDSNSGDDLYSDKDDCDSNSDIWVSSTRSTRSRSSSSSNYDDEIGPQTRDGHGRSGRDDETFSSLRSHFLMDGRGRRPHLPCVFLSNRVMLQLSSLKDEANVTWDTFLSFNLPLAFALGHILDMRHRYGTNLRGSRYLSTFFPVALLFAFSFILMVKHFPSTYSMKSIYLGPLRTGNVFLIPLSVYLVSRSSHNGPAHVNVEH